MSPAIPCFSVKLFSGEISSKYSCSCRHENHFVSRIHFRFQKQRFSDFSWLESSSPQKKDRFSTKFNEINFKGSIYKAYQRHDTEYFGREFQIVSTSLENGFEFYTNWILVFSLKIRVVRLFRLCFGKGFLTVFLDIGSDIHTHTASTFRYWWIQHITRTTNLWFILCVFANNTCVKESLPV